LDLTLEQIQQNEADKKPVEPGAGGVYLRWAALNKKLVTSGAFTSFMTSVIMVASINVGLQTDWRIMRHEEWYNGLELLDAVILYIFTLEIVMKMWAEGFTPLKFFDDSWNDFDFLIVAGSYVPGAGSSVTMLRLLRLLRVLKLVKRLPQLAVIINALLNGMVSIAYVGLVLVLFFYVFAIVAMLLFAQNDPWHFGSLHMSFFSLFQAATLDDWSILMYVSAYGCDKFAGIFEDFPEQCTDPSASGLVAVFFFLIFILIGAQVLLSLFIGVISTSMDEAQEAQGAEQGLEKKIRLTARKLLLDDRRVEAMQYVFRQLDLDNGGTIEEEELKIGMDAIEAGMTEDDIIRILQKVAPDGGGVDPNGFILFMYETPMFSRTSALSKISNAFASKGRNFLILKRGRLSQWFVDIFYWWGRKNRIKNEEMEAALTIQDAWLNRVESIRASREAKAYMQENTVDEAARRRKIQASL
jgi:voltage-gated sodium channel